MTFALDSPVPRDGCGVKGRNAECIRASSTQLIPAKAGIQTVRLRSVARALGNPSPSRCGLGPGLRRDERGWVRC